MIIYLDNLATTSVDPRVADMMRPFFIAEYGNSNSVDHDMGTLANSAVEESKIKVSKLIGCNPNQIIFTSGSTESLNTVLLGFQSKANRKINIAISNVEHKATLATCEYLVSKGLASIQWIESDENGESDLKVIKKMCESKKIDILVIMSVNNEIGNVNPVGEIASIASKYQVPYLCDATQGVGKLRYNFEDLGLDYFVFSAHKIYGPKGVGALVIRDKNTIDPIIHGGGQQHNLRSGTMNVPGVVGLGEACRLRDLEMEEEEKRVKVLSKKMRDILTSEYKNMVFIGSENKVSGSLPISFPGIPNKAIISRIRDKIAISTGAACSSGAESPSHVLTAMKLPKQVIEGFLRISIGKFNTEEEVKAASKLIISAVEDVKRCL